jgi:hypothetical protein
LARCWQFLAQPVLLDRLIQVATYCNLAATLMEDLIL